MKKKDNKNQFSTRILTLITIVWMQIKIFLISSVSWKIGIEDWGSMMNHNPTPRY